MDLDEKKQKIINYISHKEINPNLSNKKEPILCVHCKRTNSNGIRCMGICVADSDY